MDNEWRYYVLTCNNHGDLIKIGGFRTADTAALFVDAMKKAFCEQFPNLELEIEDIHSPLSFPDMILGKIDADEGAADG